MRDLVAELESAGAAVEVLEREAARGWFRSWCEVYCAKVRQATGRYRYLGFHWHAFSYQFTEARSGREAFEQYAEAEDDPLIVIPESWRTMDSVRASGIAHPDLSALKLDLYLFPESVDWTMVFTHEAPEYGPFFSRRDWA